MSYEIVEIAQDGRCECNLRPVPDDEIDHDKYEYGGCMVCGRTLAVKEK
jgi:hypothetical protein